MSLAHTAENGSGLVRHVRGFFVSLGSGPRFHLRPLRSLIPAPADAVANFCFSMILRLNNLTCASLTISTPGGPGPARPSWGRELGTRRQDGVDRQI
jgi:hypothetical protein